MIGEVVLGDGCGVRIGAAIRCPIAGSPVRAADSLIEIAGRAWSAAIDADKARRHAGGLAAP